MHKPESFDVKDLAEPLTFPVEAYLSREYAKAEGDRLWAKVWQHAGRVEQPFEAPRVHGVRVGVLSAGQVRARAESEASELLGSARREAEDELRSIEELMGVASSLLDGLPSFLGADGPQADLVAKARGDAPHINRR